MNYLISKIRILENLQIIGFVQFIWQSQSNIKRYKREAQTCFALCLLTVIIGLLFPSISYAFGKGKQAEQIIKEKPTCTSVGQLQCPGKLKPTCPKQHKPSCVFVGTMQLPSCLADSADNTFFSYNLDKISCEK